MITLQFATEAWDITSAMIRYVSWSDYSHVDFVLPTGDLLGSRASGGVQVRKPGYANFSKTLRATVDAPETVYSRAMSQVGKKYDFSSVINFGFHWNDRNWRNDKAWYCSEIVAWAFEREGVPLVNPKYQWNRVSPQDLIKSPLLHY